MHIDVVGTKNFMRSCGKINAAGAWIFRPRGSRDVLRRQNVIRKSCLCWFQILAQIYAAKASPVWESMKAAWLREVKYSEADVCKLRRNRCKNGRMRLVRVQITRLGGRDAKGKFGCGVSCFRGGACRLECEIFSWVFDDRVWFLMMMLFSGFFQNVDMLEIFLDARSFKLKNSFLEFESILNELKSMYNILNINDKLIESSE
jgi:hypothetical protein